ncbi:hypothetical protein BHM03_00008833 [Ensete ventricosum]|uniref:Uncharacterized protein n=1 Tax=Ensete ventricosum TaxID=4639 RepID=A0A445MCK0_ENSVE|nr:hypothetical protein BHM03_00008833 [Ensete ventricosum]
MEAAKAEESTAPVAEFPIQALRLLSRSLVFLSTLSAHPLFGTLAAAFLLVILYLPRSLLSLVLSPVPISTFVLLAALLRHGSPPPKCPAAAAAAVDDEEEELPPLCSETKPETKAESACYHQEVIFSNDFIGCGRRSRPLEIIYEEYEGEEECGGGGSHQYRGWLQNADLESARLGFTYAKEEEEWGDGGSEDYPMWPQNANSGSRIAGPIRFTYGTDSDTESNGGSQAASEAEGSSSPEDHRLMWEDEEDGDDMIEIELELEEENMIEIDISGGR